MGYDMYWTSHDPTPEQEAELKAAKAAWVEAVTARDEAFERDASLRQQMSAAQRSGDLNAAHVPYQDAVIAASSRVSDAEVNYFRLNISGMGVVRDCLVQTDAIHDKMGWGGSLDWPSLDAYGLEEPPETSTWDEASSSYVERQLTAEEEAYEKAVRDKLAAGVEYPGIPVHKLCSNDGWIVTPPECVSAAKLWLENRQRVVDSGEHETRWIELTDKFMTWVAEAAQHEGFTVH